MPHHETGSKMVEKLHHPGHVMVCTARDCKWNDDTRCVAKDGVMVNFHQDHADCNTYTLNRHIPGETPGTGHF